MAFKKYKTYINRPCDLVKITEIVIRRYYLHQWSPIDLFAFTFGLSSFKYVTNLTFGTSNR